MFVQEDCITEIEILHYTDNVVEETFSPEFQIEKNNNETTTISKLTMGVLFFIQIVFGFVYFPWTIFSNFFFKKKDPNSDIRTKPKPKNTIDQKLKNVFFFSTEQYKLWKNPDKKKVCFTADYGTGKTTLLMAKINQLAKNNELILVIIWSKLDTCLLLQHYQIIFSNNPYIKICGFKTSGKMSIKQFKTLLTNLKNETS